MLDAMRLVGGEPELLWHGDATVNGVDAVIVPGGFAHGDYLRPGAIARFSPVMSAVAEFAAAGGPVVGICNGFQVLTEAGLLPGVLTRNKKMKFICQTMNLRVENKNSAFTRKYNAHQIIRVPIAHMDGNYFADSATLKKLEDTDSIAFRYINEDGNLTDEANPNGSLLNIAGIFNEKKNVLGMMPHPERAIDIDNGSGDGLILFNSLLN